MARYVKGDHAVETSNAREGVQLRAQGYREEKSHTKATGKTPAAPKAEKAPTKTK